MNFLNRVLTSLVEMRKKTLNVLGIFIMRCVTFNDASTNVMAYAIKDVHYSLMQFWFGAIGLILLT